MCGGRASLGSLDLMRCPNGAAVIIEFAELRELSGRVTMVDGSFDPLHDGHVAYFRAAAELGRPLLCNVATDDWTRTKHPVLLPRERRVRVIDALRDVAYVHAGEQSTAEVLRELIPAVYAKGVDWRDRGGIPQIEAEICRELNIELCYLDTVLNSSTELLRRYRSGS